MPTVRPAEAIEARNIIVVFLCTQPLRVRNGNCDALESKRVVSSKQGQIRGMGPSHSPARWTYSREIGKVRPSTHIDGFGVHQGIPRGI
jgi:hypothetical protein